MAIDRYRHHHEQRSQQRIDQCVDRSPADGRDSATYGREDQSDNPGNQSRNDPDHHHQQCDEDGNPYLTVRKDEMIADLVAMVQALNTRLGVLEKRLA